MTKTELSAKIDELIAAPMCQAALRTAAENYKADPSKANADALVKSLEENVNSIDDTIAFAGSDAGKKIFGADVAAEAVKKGKELKSQGAKYCFCAACTAGGAIYDNKEAL